MYDSTFTFKTRRKHQLILLLCLALATNVASMAMPLQCPEPCDCYINSNGIQSARCSEIFSNQTAFPNIHVLVLRSADYQDECHIPKHLAKVLPQLNFLYMMNCSLTNVPGHIFKDLTSLEEVDLSYNHIKKLDPSLFIHNDKLGYANLQNNPLHISDRPFLISKSLRELDLTSCGIHHIPFNMFKNLTHLRYLTLYNNQIRTVEENTLPSHLKTINLARNHIMHVPTGELLRLKRIKEIDLSENPINCTCELMGFQNWVSGKGVIFSNGIECAYPREYSGRMLVDLPQYEICDAKVQAATECENDDICSNQILPEEGSTKKNDIIDDFERDQVVPVGKKGVVDYVNDMQSDSVGEGSGDDAGTEQPDIFTSEDKETKPTEAAKTEPKEPTSEEPKASTEPAEGKPSESSSTTEKEITNKKLDVTMYHEEIPTTEDQQAKQDTTIPPDSPKEEPKVSESPEPKLFETPQPDVSESPKTEVPETPQPDVSESPKPEVPESPEPKVSSETPDTTEKSTESETLRPNENKTGDGSFQPLQHNSMSDASVFNLGYVIPFLAIIIVIIICLGVYLGQRSSQKKDWDPKVTSTNNDGTEMQDVSLLPDKSKTPIVKNAKYPSEGNSEQTERLMGDAPPPNSVWENLEEPIENGNAKHADKLPNGNDEPIQHAIAKVTTLPDSVPRTPIIRHT